MSLYGKPKSGKTSVISSFPKPVLIIGAEDGTRSIRNVKDVFFVRVLLEGAAKPKNGSCIYLHELGDLIDQVEGEYETVALDTASALQDLILCDILGLQELPAQKSWGMASRDQYGQCSLKLKTMLRKILELPTHVIITAHERNFSEETSDSELIMPSVGSALSPSVTGWLNGAVDYICQTFIREEVETKIAKVNNKEVKTNKKTGKCEYCLRVGPHPIYMTGFRLPPGFDLPEVIVNPTYDKIDKIIRGIK